MWQEWLPAGKVAKHEGASVAGEPQEGVQLLRDAIQDASPGVPSGKVDGTRFENFWSKALARSEKIDNGYSNSS